MKTCPVCHTRYSDDTLKYCLQDGSMLGVEPPEGAPTVVLSDAETVTHVEPRNTGTSGVSTQIGPQGRSSVVWIVAATAVGVVLLLALGAIGAYFYFSGQKNAANTVNKDTRTPSKQQSNLPASPAATTEPRVTPKPDESKSDVEQEDIKRDISERIADWKQSMESGDLDSYMESYAGTVDYYNKKNADISAVRADKARAFSLYDSMQIDLSNVNVTIGSGGNTATAVFDKEWSFEGQRNSYGKVRTELELKKMNGQWLITGEKDTKVYYTR